MSVKVEIDEEATGFQILDGYLSREGKDVCVTYTSSYEPECDISLIISPEMFREILAEMEGDDE